MNDAFDSAVRAIVAALGGAAVGIERQWSGHATGAQARLGGIRTFTLLGGLAGLSGLLWGWSYPALATVLLAGGAALVIAGYVVASARSVEATTEVAAMVVLASGALAGTGHLALASGAIAITCLLLVEKSRLHSWVARLDDTEVRAGARFAVMAVVVLPLLPTGPFGPYASVKPRELWALVLLLSGLSFAGYIARGAIGSRRGHVVTGLLAGLISSTSATLSFARESRASRAEAHALALGALAACSMMFARLIAVTTLLEPELGIVVGRLLAAPLLVGGATTLLGLWRAKPSRAAPMPSEGNPLQLVAALQMALLFQLVLVVVSWVRGMWGGAGVVALGALLGLTDTDALALSMARSATATGEMAVAGTAIALGGLSNTLLKLLLGVVVGEARFRVTAGVGLGAMAAASAVALWLGTR